MAVEQTTLTPVPERQPARRSTLSSAHSGTPADVASSVPKIVQCGLYATEMLCGSYGVSHSINLFIVGMLMRLPFCVADVHFVTDANLWILYTDRQGCIQSHGFNFIRDLPTFFVLLLALQRLDLTEMGLKPCFGRTSVPRAPGACWINNEEGRTREPNEWKIKINAEPVTLRPKEIALYFDDDGERNCHR